jgi:superfamily II DNA or RNA helicase
LPSKKVYPPDAVGTLVTEVLPELLKRFKVEVTTKKLPELTREAKPRAVVQVQQDGERFAALLTLVYGDPPLARIDAGRLVHLRGPVPLRDEALEQRVASRAQAELGLNVGGRVWLSGEAAIALAQKLERWSGAVEGVKGKRLLFQNELVPQLSRSLGALQLHFESSEGGDTLKADPAQVLRAWREHDAWVPLLSGGWAPLPAGWLDKHGALLEQVLDGLATRALDLPTSVQAAAALNGSLDSKAAQNLPALAELCELLDFPTPPELEPFRALLRGTNELPAIALPPDLNATLRSYQQQGVRWLSLLKSAGLGAVLADDMGLGKTLQTICNLAGRCLVVCPTSVVHNWASELERFRPGLRFHVYQGKGRSLKPDVDVTITSYALLRLDQDVLGSVEWDQLVLDEAQHIKNPESQVARAAYRMRARFKLALSGTPIENRLSELWSLFHFTNRGLLGGRSDFQARYELPIANGDARASGALRQRIAPFILRRNKSSVAKELPPRTDLFIHCTLDTHERAVYDSIYQATQRDVVQELRKGGSVMLALEALLRLRQAACHSALVPGVQVPNAKLQPIDTDDEAQLDTLADESTDTPRDAADPRPGLASSKIRALIEALEQVVAEGHRALVFSQWTSLLDKVEPELERAGLSRGRLDGSTKDRAGVVNEFQSETGPSVLLLSLKAGGTGLNLTAADHVFLLDPWWNPAVEQQAADRAHRIGQQRPVFVHRLIATGTVEEKIVRLQAQKRELAEAALEGTEATASLGREELLDLLS